MNFFILTLLSFLCCISDLTFAQEDLHLSVRITDQSDYCFILPKHRMDIGQSENGGNDLVYSYCSKPQANQRKLPDDMWISNSPTVEVKRWKKSGHVRWKQITGCFDPTKFKNLNAGDDGGQYDQKGGENGMGNPTNSYCQGFSSYVELVEPSSNQICLRCCHKDADCPVTMDKAGCQTVIPGTYCN